MRLAPEAVISADWEELLLSQYGLEADEVDEIARSILVQAFIRRKKWEARVEAVELVNALNEALGGKKEQVREVGPEEFMKIAGMEIK